jgi:hypothetical protein
MAGACRRGWTLPGLRRHVAHPPWSVWPTCCSTWTVPPWSSSSLVSLILFAPLQVGTNIHQLCVLCKLSYHEFLIWHFCTLCLWTCLVKLPFERISGTVIYKRCLFWTSRTLQYYDHVECQNYLLCNMYGTIPVRLHVDKIFFIINFVNLIYRYCTVPLIPFST